MSTLLSVCLQEVAEHLDELGFEWCLVGGLAISVRSEPRFTRDVDVAVLVSDDSEAEAIVRHFHSLGWQSVAVL